MAYDRAEASPAPASGPGSAPTVFRWWEAFWTRRPFRAADLREAFLSLTPQGRAVYEELAPRARDFTEKLSEVVPAADRAAFERAMAQLTERSAALVAEAEGKRRSET